MYLAGIYPSASSATYPPITIPNGWILGYYRLGILLRELVGQPPRTHRIDLFLAKERATDSHGYI
jgi:hypothetical protein